MRWPSWLMASCAILAACEDTGLPPAWRLSGYRVMAVEAQPPEVSPDGYVTLTAYDLDTEARDITYTWSVCLYSLGAHADFRCVDPALSQPLPDSGPVARLDLGPEGLGLRRLYERYRPIVGIDGEEITFEEGFDVYVHLVASAPGGRAVSVYKRVRVRDGVGLNRNPFIFGVVTDEGLPLETLRPGEAASIRVEVDETSRDQDPEGRDEAFTDQWFTVSGRLSEGVGVMKYTAPSMSGEDTIYVVVRDGRGGTAVYGAQVVIEEGR